MKSLGEDMMKYIENYNKTRGISEFNKELDTYIRKNKKSFKKDVKKDIKNNYKDYKSDLKKFYKKQGTYKFYKKYIGSFNYEDFEDLYKETITYVDTLFNNVEKNMKTDYIKALNEYQRLSNIGAKNTKVIAKELAQKYGNPFMTFSNGRRYPAQSYFDMVVNGMRTRQNISSAKNIASSLETDVYIYTSRANSAQRCVPLQNKPVSFGQSKSVKDVNGNRYDVLDLYEYNYGSAGGPLGANCGHDVYPVVNGLFKI